MTEQRVATFAVDPGHPIFAGHFPSEPIVPGVILLEWVLVEAARVLGRGSSHLRIREAKFFEPLLPAQQAELFLDAAPARCVFRVRRAHSDLASGVLEWTAHG